MRTFIAIGLTLCLATHAFAQQMQATAPLTEIEILQRRLTDAGCYGGPIDGKSSADLERAKKSCPNQDPQLGIETGMHVGVIKSIAVDAKCSLAVTGSMDKTIRIWSLPEGGLRRTIRPPVGSDQNGVIYVVALSPDGKWVAAGGWLNDGLGYYVTLFAMDGREPPRRLGPLPEVALSIAFSPDGRRLAAGLGNAKGVHIFDVRSGKQIYADSESSQNDTRGLAYAQDGTLYTVSRDGMLRAYGPDLVRKKKVAVFGNRPTSIALSPDGTRLAVGYRETRVDIFAVKDLTLLATADTSNGVSELFTVGWMADGTLYGSGMFSAVLDGVSLIRGWDNAGRRQGEDRPLARDAVLDLRPCGRGLAFSSADPSFGLIGPSGAALSLGASVAADMRGKLRNSFQISADARQVYFGLEIGDRKGVLFDLNQAKLSEAERPPERFISARLGGMPVADWEDQDSPTYAGKKLPFERNDRSRSLAIRHDNSGFFLGSQFALRAYDSKGIQKGEAKSVTGGVWGAVLSPDDKILVISSSDGTIRWFRAEDRTELLTLFVDTRDRRWVAWTPSGYYMASAGGENLIGWHINRGWGQEAEFFPASQFHDRYYRPDIVQLVLKTLDEKVAVQMANSARVTVTQQPASTRSIALPPLIAVLPPQVTIVSPADGTSFYDPSVEITYRVRAAVGQTVSLVQALVDGRVVSSQRGKIEDQSEGTFTLPVPKQNVVIEVKAASGSLAGQSARVKLAFGGAPPARPTASDLYVLAIGVDDYINSQEFPKTYADVDVAGLTGALKKQEGDMFAHVIIKSLLGDQANVTSVRGAFDELSQAKDDDYVVIYIAGHGYVGADLRYRFMLRSGDVGHLNASSLTARDLLDPLSTVRGKKLMLVESCHAGVATQPSGPKSGYSMDYALNNLREVAPSDLIIFGASQAYELAQFNARWEGRGAFTHALIEAIEESKAAERDGTITILSLYRYLQDRIPAMTNQQQHPTVTPPLKDISDFVVAKTRK